MSQSHKCCRYTIPHQVVGIIAIYCWLVNDTFDNFSTCIYILIIELTITRQTKKMCYNIDDSFDKEWFAPLFDYCLGEF